MGEYTTFTIIHCMDMEFTDAWNKPVGHNVAHGLHQVAAQQQVR